VLPTPAIRAAADGQLVVSPREGRRKRRAVRRSEAAVLSMRSFELKGKLVSGSMQA
jgi:hypothetical protein